MRLLLVLVIAVYASAFVPSRTAGRSSALSMSAEASKSLPFLKKPKNLDGYIGNAEFDPLGFAENFDVRFLREAELKHGRISMLAVVGWLVQVSQIFTSIIMIIIDDSLG